MNRLRLVAERRGMFRTRSVSDWDRLFSERESILRPPSKLNRVAIYGSRVLVEVRRWLVQLPVQLPVRRWLVLLPGTEGVGLHFVGIFAQAILKVASLASDAPS